MRKFLKENGEVFMQTDRMEKKQVRFELETNQRFEQVFNALQSKDSKPRQGIFFDNADDYLQLLQDIRS